MILAMATATQGRRWHRIVWMVSLSLGLTCGLLSCTQKPTPAPSQPPTREQVSAALIGNWESVDEEKSWSGNQFLSFRPDGTFVAIGQDNAIGTYWIKPTIDPMALDLALDDAYSSFRGVFRFVDSETLELTEKAVGVSDPVRPVNFQGFRMVYKRVINAAKMPTGNFSNRLPPVPLRENRGQDYVVSTLFIQRNYFDHKRQFNTEFFQPSTGYHDEDMDYTYRLVAQGDVLWVFGQSKHPDLCSFTGALATGQGYSSVIRLCKSRLPSLQPPAMYRMGHFEFQCGPDADPK